MLLCVKCEHKTTQKTAFWRVEIDSLRSPDTKKMHVGFGKSDVAAVPTINKHFIHH